MDLDDINRTASINLDPKKYENALRKVMFDLAADVSKFGVLISESDLDRLEKIRKSLDRIATKHLQNITETVVARRQNLLRYQNVQICSLGFDCFARTVLTRWGLKKPAKLGEKSMPFDLAIHPAHAVSEALDNDFSMYSSDEVTLSEVLGHYVVDRLNVKFNHDKDILTASDSQHQLTNRYLKRAENFREILRSEKAILFIHHSHDASLQSQQNVLAIADKLRATRGGRPTEFGWICNQYGEVEHIDISKQPHFRVLNLPYPSNNYKWWRPRDSFSADGIRFEKKVVEWVKAYLNDMTLIPRLSPVDVV